MHSPLLESKLYLPRNRQALVPRARLAERLRRRDGIRLTLVSAPAGFGKTTLLSALVTERPGRTAWVSLEESDRHATTFWTYLLTALERAAPGVGEGGLGLLQSGQAPIESVLAVVLNELSVLPDDVDLVLDDYHLADGPEIQPGMAFLVEHLPPQVQLLISTRADPALPLARLRARGELVEIRAADLRFTADEATAYLNDLTGLDLDAADIATLEGRTEGWIAALRLAALSLQGRDDATAFIEGFAGDDRYVVDYLLDEVLDRQADDVRRFLLETSIADRLTGPLCDAVTGRSGGKAMLETLERQNLFLVPLDDHRRWYRYHHLFGDVLRTHLREERGDLGELHRRASRWYEEAGETVAAVRHALAAGDADHAADLVELAVPALQRERLEPTLRRWLDDIPNDVVQKRPVLAVGFIGALMSCNEFDGVGQRIDDVERVLAGPADVLAVVDRGELAKLPGAIETYRAALALAGGDPAATIEHAGRAIDRAVDGDHLTSAAASALAGLANWAAGDLEAAHAGYTTAARDLQRIGYIADVLGCSITLADIETTQGRLRQAQTTFERALDLGEGLRGTADMYVGLSRLALERNDLDAASNYLRRAEDLGPAAGLPQNPYRWRVAMARLREAEGDLVGARDQLDAAERVYVGDFAPNVRPIAAHRARVMVAQGHLSAARDWVRQQGLSANDGLSYLREFEHMTLARILLAERARGEAIRLLERLQAAAWAGGRIGTVIEILVLRALAQDDVAPLERSLTLAEPEGYVRVFIAEGPPMTSMLASLAQRRPDWPYPRRLLDAVRRPTSQAPKPTGEQVLVEPLSDRELDVLRLLAGELDGPSIARQLVVSLNTVRTHTKHIYAKLGVTNRRSAVRRAHQLNLLTR
ncbi:tetratricopeptide repeat protein [Kribbella capetownensis]|uniref:Tetratricopeptide repeat protein n=1 Tax=Kribbella capetownensis TaxID=1572659 RepID=A0A4R0K211_9ACTN|nr:LuxR C-terminal-related transcriptional regulator [Kribbella capetownensis]TCC48865.1 tetratricopeptide repeat protein [Kribbella capetownensis]